MEFVNAERGWMTGCPVLFDDSCGITLVGIPEAILSSSRHLFDLSCYAIKNVAEQYAASSRPMAKASTTSSVAQLGSLDLIALILLERNKSGVEAMSAKSTRDRI